MTTSTVEEAAVGRARAKDAGEPAVEISGVTRREFLYYVWGASMAMALGACGGILIWFALPRFREGEFGGNFVFAGDQLPSPETTAPEDNPQGRFWLSNTDAGMAALYKVCTHLGCLYKWVDANTRFECPCHGSKFQLNGLYIEGPAPRGLDRFEVTVVLDDGTEITNDENGMVHLSEDQRASVRQFVVHTGRKIKGPPAGTSEYA